MSFICPIPSYMGKQAGEGMNFLVCLYFCSVSCLNGFGKADVLLSALFHVKGKIESYVLWKPTWSLEWTLDSVFHWIGT